MTLLSTQNEQVNEAHIEDPALCLKVNILPHGENLPLPCYATKGSSGIDLRAACLEAITLLPHERVLVPTGLRLVIPPKFEAQIRSRSGLALKNGVIVLNSPGTIDADYHEEIFILLSNTSTEPFVIERGMRIAQLVVAPVIQVHIEVIQERALKGTSDCKGAISVCADVDGERRGGFGSTGIQ